MPLQLKQKKGALHVGGGRFFYPGEVYEEKDIPAHAKKYFEEAKSVVKTYTATELKKLNKEQQEDLIAKFEGDPTTVKNEEERIALILDLQEG